MNGSWRRKVTITGKKSLKKRRKKGQIKARQCVLRSRQVGRQAGNTHPKRLRKPNISTITPIAGHLKKTRSIPPRKQAVPRNLFLRAKK